MSLKKVSGLLLMIGEIALSEKEVDDILDFVISNSNHWQIYYLWRPLLKDPGDDMVLELAVTANCKESQQFRYELECGCHIP
jgi:hypothetical protein